MRNLLIWSEAGLSNIEIGQQVWPKYKIGFYEFSHTVVLGTSSMFNKLASAYTSLSRNSLSRESRGKESPCNEKWATNFIYFLNFLVCAGNNSKNHSKLVATSVYIQRWVCWTYKSDLSSTTKCYQNYFYYNKTSFLVQIKFITEDSKWFIYKY